MLRCVVLILCWLNLAACGVSDGTSGKPHVIVVVGAPGASEFGSKFGEWAHRWQTAAEKASAEWTIIGSAEEHSENGVSDLARLTSAVRDAALLELTEPLWVVLIGHGTWDGRLARFNLRGPDLNAEALAVALHQAQRPVVCINCASCSAPFVNVISAPGRVVVTATKDGGQIQFAHFGDAMSSAILSADADVNHDGQVSLLEATVLASRRTAEFYESAGRLATEHSLLDDNGDSRGTRSSSWSGPRLEIAPEESADGRLAAQIHLIPSQQEQRFTAEQRQQRAALESRLEEVRGRRYELSEAEYLDHLETILVRLARLYGSLEESTVADTPKSDVN